jgi:hypothetical protein
MHRRVLALALVVACSSSDPPPDAGAIDAAGTPGDASLACTSNADCTTPGYVCDYPAVMACVPGTCMPDDGGDCGGAAVCGCDGVTYPDGCQLVTAGVKKQCDGACPCP